MPGSEFANRLEMSNQELIDNLNSRRYLPPPVQAPVGNPLYQNIMGAQGGFDPSTGYNDPYALERRIAQGRASRAYADAMEAQTERESLHTGIGTALMAVPGVGMGLSFAYQPFAKAMGWLDPEEVYSREDYTKASMAQALTSATMGQMGSSFLSGNLSMDQANSLSDDIYGFMREKGFQGLELNRIMPMLGESGLLTPTGKFTDTDEALNQFQDRLEGFLDKVASTVRSTSVDIESATALAVSESMLAGSRDAVAGGDYMHSARLMSSITGGSLQESSQAMRASMGSWGSTIFDRTALAESTVFNVNAAASAATTGGEWDAAWINQDPGEFGARMTGMGNQYWASHRKDLGRMWSAGAMPGGAAWNSMIAGEGIPDDIGSYGDIGNYNTRLEAQYYGMEAAANNPNQMTAAAMGMYVNEMNEAGATSRRGQIAYMSNHGWQQDEAVAYLDMYDQLSSSGGRFASYFGAEQRFQDVEIEDLKSGFNSILSGTAALSQEHNVGRQSALASEFARNVGVNTPQALAATRAWAVDEDTNFDWDIGLDPGEGGRFNISTAGTALGTFLEARGIGGAEQDIMEGALMRADVRAIRGMNVNRGGASDANLDMAIMRAYNQIEGAPRLGRAQDWGDDEYEAAWKAIQDSGAATESFLGYNVNYDYNGRREETAIRDLLMGPSGRAMLEGDLPSFLSEEFTERMSDYRNNYSNLERMYNTGYGGGLSNQVVGLAFAGGYMDNVNYIDQTTRGNFQAADTNMQNMMVLGGIKENYIDYNHEEAYRNQYQEFLGNLTDAGVNFGSATEGLDPSNATNQMALRDELARAGGFGSSYAGADQIEKDFIEGYIQRNDTAPGDPEWAGPHTDLAGDARQAALGSAGKIDFESMSGYGAAIGRAASREGVTSQQVSSYGMYQIALERGENELAQQLKDELGSDFESAGGAFLRFQTTQGLNLSQAGGAAVAAPAISAIERAAGEAGIAGRSEEIYNYLRENEGSLEGFNFGDVNNRLRESSIYKLSQGTLSEDDFWKEIGAEGSTWAIPGDISNQRRLTNISEFEGSVQAIVTPAGGAMPVVMAEDINIDISALQALYAANNEAAANTDPDQGV